MGGFGSRGGFRTVGVAKSGYSAQKPLGKYLTQLSESVVCSRDAFDRLSQKDNLGFLGFWTNQFGTRMRPEEIRYTPYQGQPIFAYFQRGTNELVGVETEQDELVYRNEAWIRTIERHNALYRVTL